MPENSICIVRSSRGFAGQDGPCKGPRKPLINYKSSLEIEDMYLYINKPARRTKKKQPSTYIGAEFDRRYRRGQYILFSVVFSPSPPQPPW
jgi:hypothetical protein